MKNLNSLVLATIFASVIVLFGVTENKIQADTELTFDSCKDVRFNFRNGRTDEIQITKVHYYNQNKGRWKTETIPYNSCYSAFTCHLPGQNLGDSEGDDITRVKFEYKIRPNRSSDNWSGNYESGEFQPDIPRCRTNKSYGGNAWIIS